MDHLSIDARLTATFSYPDSRFSCEIDKPVLLPERNESMSVNSAPEIHLCSKFQNLRLINHTANLPSVISDYVVRYYTISLSPENSPTRLKSASDQVIPGATATVATAPSKSYNNTSASKPRDND